MRGVLAERNRFGEVVRVVMYGLCIVNSINSI